MHVEWKPSNENTTGVGDSWAVIDSDDKEEFEVGHEATEGLCRYSDSFVHPYII